MLAGPLEVPQPLGPVSNRAEATQSAPRGGPLTGSMAGPLAPTVVLQLWAEAAAYTCESELQAPLQLCWGGLGGNCSGLGGPAGRLTAFGACTPPDE